MGSDEGIRMMLMIKIGRVRGDLMLDRRYGGLGSSPMEEDENRVCTHCHYYV